MCVCVCVCARGGQTENKRRIGIWTGDEMGGNDCRVSDGGVGMLKNRKYTSENTNSSDKICFFKLN